MARTLLENKWWLRVDLTANEVERHERSEP